MKSPTVHYRQLGKDLKKAKLLTAGINPAGCKNDIQRLQLQGYILLCHSAIETFIEDLGKSVALESRKIFIEKGYITKTLVALISSKLIDELKESSKKKLSSDLVSNVNVFSESACTKYIELLKNNHGISKKYLKNIFIPIGFDPEEIDIILANNMESFASKRGSVAHKFAIHTEHNLSDIDSTLDSILRDLESYDKEAVKCLKLRIK